MVYYILGFLSASAIGVFIWTIARGKGGHNESGIDNATRREGILNKRIEELQGKLLIAGSDISRARGKISGLNKRIAQAEDRIKSSDGLVDDLKERNGL